MNILLDANSRLTNVIWVRDQKIQGICKAHMFRASFLHQSVTRHLECLAECVHYFLWTLPTVQVERLQNTLSSITGKPGICKGIGTSAWLLQCLNTDLQLLSSAIAALPARLVHDKTA